MSAISAAVEAFAPSQHGLVTTAQLRAAGCSQRSITSAIATRELRPVERGVLRAGGAPITWESRILAGCLAFDAVASHRTAAALFELGGMRRGSEPELSIRHGRSGRRSGYRMHWSSDLDLVERVVIDGLPTTPVHRTIVDLGAVCPDAVVERAIDEALTRRLITWDELEVTYLQHRRRGRRGCGALRRILERRCGNGDVAESVLERRMIRILDDAGIGGFVTQHEIRDADRFVMRTDIAWPALMVAIEMDSVAFHLNARAFQQDRAKRNRARSLGWLILEYTSLDLSTRRTAILAEIRGVLESRELFSLRPGTAQVPERDENRVG